MVATVAYTQGTGLTKPPHSGATIGGTITGGTQGSVIFVNPDGTLAQDNSHFYYDETNNRLGVGVSPPLFPLDARKVFSATDTSVYVGHFVATGDGAEDIAGVAAEGYKTGITPVTDMEAIYTFSGNANASGKITSDETIYIDSPYAVGPMDYHTGLFINEQAYGTANYTIDAGSSTAPSRFGGSVTVSSFLKITPQASPPSSPTEGMIYTDTSHAICYYDGSAWQKMAGAGTCS